jgi:phosphoenolpyruvate-protein phosphotransferase (PTS system enzyme I)
MPELAPTSERVFRGIGVSPGVCRAKILVLARPEDHRIPEQHVGEEQVSNELRRLEQALVATRRQIMEVQRQVSASLGPGEAGIFDAHLLVLEDPTVTEEVSRKITTEKVIAEYAFQQVTDQYVRGLAAIEDEYLRERAADVRDIATRILNNLLGRDHEADLKRLTEPCIIVAHDLSPSQTAQLDKKVALGFATDIGSQTSHSAIMARSLRIPAVVGLQSASRELHSGQYVLLDGFNGLIVLNPTDQTLFEYGQLVQRQVSLEEKLRETRDQPAVTLDGARIILSANIEQAADTEAVLLSGAEGVGLFRTEYLFINRDTLPTEEEQYEAYRRVAVAVKPHPVVIRTLDLGGDKFNSRLQLPREMNPSLGWRAIRFCLQEKEIFCAQLRAILRAGTEGNVKMMYPMISGLKEVEQANAILEECKAELRAKNTSFDEHLDVGVMIEIPSAALSAVSLAQRVKFFSIGTNDLIQYALAVDRLNERIAHLYQPTHPAILHLIHMTVQAALPRRIWAGVCGEMAGDPILVPLLLGLGIEELSVAPGSVPRIKYLIRRMRLIEAKALAEFALNCECGSEILERCRAYACSIAEGLFEKR